MSEIVTVRDLAMVTSDIQYAQRQGARQLASNLIEIGRLLVEAKTMVESKNWDKYIWDNFGYSTSSADNWMKLYREYGDNQESLFDSFTNSQTFGKLSYTQLLALTALPAEERSEFVENNDVENMSTRQLQQAIRERDEARKAADAAETELAGAKTALDKARRDAAADAEEINSKLHQAQEARANAEKSESHALDMVKKLVAYCREQEKIHNKNFRFTMTTNGVLIDDDVIDFCNKECHNVVLSLDGRNPLWSGSEKRQKPRPQSRPPLMFKSGLTLLSPKCRPLSRQRPPLKPLPRRHRTSWWRHRRLKRYPTRM